MPPQHNGHVVSLLNATTLEKSSTWEFSKL